MLENLDQFLNSPIGKECRAQEKYLIKFSQDMAYQNIPRITEVLEHTLSANYSTWVCDSIPGENDEFYISGVYLLDNIEIFDVDYDGRNNIWLDVGARVEIDYEFSIFNSDTYDLDSSKYHFSYLNDHYMEAESHDTFEFRASIGLSYPESVVPHLVDKVDESDLKNSEILVDEIRDFKILDESVE